jgi:hypothetical protein
VSSTVETHQIVSDHIRHVILHPPPVVSALVVLALVAGMSVGTTVAIPLLSTPAIRVLLMLLVLLGMPGNTMSRGNITVVWWGSIELVLDGHIVKVHGLRIFNHQDGSESSFV